MTRPSISRAIHRAASFVASPIGFIAAAALIGLTFAIAHMLCLRACTSVLSGSVSSPDMTFDEAAVRGIVYAATYFAAVVLGPIFLIAALVLRILEGRFGRRKIFLG